MEIKYTYGKTPAAIYLERAIEGEPNSVKRSVGQSISNTKRQVHELLDSFERDALTSKTVANILRLMREDVSRNRKDTLISMLSSNVQIGHIKRAIRLMTEQRKNETMMNKPSVLERFSYEEYRPKNFPRGEIYVKRITRNGEVIGECMKFDDGYVSSYAIKVDIYTEDKTPEELMEKSIKRLERLGKHQEV